MNGAEESTHGLAARGASTEARQSPVGAGRHGTVVHECEGEGMSDALTERNVGTGGRPYVLVVEDDSACKRMLVTQLRQDGFEVDGVDDGSTAMCSLKERRPDLVCVDLGLPMVSGFELCKWVRHDPSLASVPLLVVTCRTSLEDLTHATEAGADEILSKPYRHAELLAAARRLLESRPGGSTTWMPVVQ